MGARPEHAIPEAEWPERTRKRLGAVARSKRLALARKGDAENLTIAVARARRVDAGPTVTPALEGKKPMTIVSETAP